MLLTKTNKGENLVLIGLLTKHGKRIHTLPWRNNSFTVLVFHMKQKTYQLMTKKILMNKRITDTFLKESS